MAKNFYTICGTTAVAARKQNRNFIGIEKSDVYYQIALNRLKN